MHIWVGAYAMNHNTHCLHVTTKNVIVISKEHIGTEMKIIPLFIFALISGAAFGATDWWNQNTICTIDDTRCYSAPTAGIDFSLETGWDVSGGCRGKKYICPGALTMAATEPVAMERAAIMAYTGINHDFDTNTYVSGENCYGARKSTNGGAMVLLNGEYVRVWCRGVLSNATEELQYGEITAGAQPTCSALAADNYAAILDGKCYGKYYNPNKYAVECNGDVPMLILLNGANYNPSGRGVTESDANSTFNSMVTTSSGQRGIHFNR